MNEMEIKVERVEKIFPDDRSQLEKVVEKAIGHPLLHGEEFFPKHKLESPERRKIFIRHYLERAKEFFYDYLIKQGEEIIGYAAIDKGYNAIKELFAPTVHFAFVNSNQYIENVELLLTRECERIDTANKSGRYQIPF